MTKIRFEDLPSTNTPINAENLNKLNNVIVSSEEPTTGEEVWFKKGKNLLNAPFTENNKYILTATKDDHYKNTDYKCYLEKDVTYTVSFESDGEPGDEGDTVEIYLIKEGGYSTMWNFKVKQRTITAQESGYYFLRMDVNKNGATHSFWNIQVEEGDEATSFELYTKEVYTRANNEYEKFYKVGNYREYDVIYNGKLLVDGTLELGNTKRFLDVYFTMSSNNLMGKYTIDTSMGDVSFGSIILLAPDSETALEYYVDESTYNSNTKVFTHKRSGYFNISNGTYTARSTAAYHIYRIETYD